MQAGQLKAFGNFKQRALAPALKEVNLWAPFRLTIAYKKTGQRVTEIALSWCWKDKQGRKAAQAELEKSKIGRKARMEGVKETIVLLETGAIEELGAQLPDLEK